MCAALFMVVFHYLIQWGLCKCLLLWIMQFSTLASMSIHLKSYRIYCLSLWRVEIPHSPEEAFRGNIRLKNCNAAKSTHFSKFMWRDFDMQNASGSCFG
ncbi:hypothetical protein SLEP1_g46098 [Rubroshorea leprosula]|uniref:Secreted protein n=1 Tax=Rubroshorea leprosula TaxID=152421 RepID=A0AAV5LN29_9ROSI|nr:hypothetical protein SLEP1_g46098 [Rubroshorea leprosula]